MVHNGIVENHAELRAALEEHAGTLAADTLAVRVIAAGPPVPLAAHRDEDLGITFWVRAAGE